MKEASHKLLSYIKENDNNVRYEFENINVGIVRYANEINTNLYNLKTQNIIFNQDKPDTSSIDFLTITPNSGENIASIIEYGDQYNTTCMYFYDDDDDTVEDLNIHSLQAYSNSKKYKV